MYRKLTGMFRINEWYSDVYLWYLVVIALSFFYTTRSFSIAIVFALYHLLMLCYCYYVNSWADLDQDRVAGKKNILAKFGKQMRLSLLIVFSVLALLLPFLFINNFLVMFIAYANLFLTAFYSLRPLRFKERGFMGIIVAALVQGPLAYLMFALYVNLNAWVFLGFLAWIFLIEALDDLTHQIEDYFNDRKARVNTWTTGKGVKINLMIARAFFLLGFLLPLCYLLLDIYKGIFINLVLSAFTYEKYTHFKESIEQHNKILKKHRNTKTHYKNAGNNPNQSKH